MALPCRAPPACSMARAVVSVNSSMFARVPGPAKRLAVDATISAYNTGAVLPIAATTGIVAWPPQVTLFRLAALQVPWRRSGIQEDTKLIWSYNIINFARGELDTHDST